MIDANEVLSETVIYLQGMRIICFILTFLGEFLNKIFKGGKYYTRVLKLCWLCFYQGYII